MLSGGDETSETKHGTEAVYAKDGMEEGLAFQILAREQSKVSAILALT